MRADIAPGGTFPDYEAWDAGDHSKFYPYKNS